MANIKQIKLPNGAIYDIVDAGAREALELKQDGIVHHTEAVWTTEQAEYIPILGELIIYDIDSSYTYERMKIGDGITTAVNLPFLQIDWDHIVGKPTSEDLFILNCGSATVNI